VQTTPSRSRECVVRSLFPNSTLLVTALPTEGSLLARERFLGRLRHCFACPSMPSSCLCRLARLPEHPYRCIGTCAASALRKDSLQSFRS